MADQRERINEMGNGTPALSQVTPSTLIHGHKVVEGQNLTPELSDWADEWTKDGEVAQSVEREWERIKCSDLDIEGVGCVLFGAN